MVAAGVPSFVLGLLAFESRYLPLIRGHVTGVQYWFSPWEVVTSLVVAAAVLVVLGRWKFTILTVGMLVVCGLALWFGRYLVFFVPRSFCELNLLWIFLPPPTFEPWGWGTWIYAIMYSTVVYTSGVLAAILLSVSAGSMFLERGHLP